MSLTLSKKVASLLAAAVLAMGAAFGLAGCSGSGSSDSASSGSAGGDQTVTVTVDAEGNLKADVTEVKAGNVTFTVNTESPAVSEIELLYNQKIVGEKENLAPGLDPVSFTKSLDGGDYKIYAPGANEEFIDFKVTGEAAAAPTGTAQEIMKKGVADYATYANEQLGLLVESTKTLQSTIESGDVEKSKEAWADARAFYEHVESAVDGFLMPGANAEDGNNLENLDYLIDMRESSLDSTLPEDKQWHGFHAIERDLWKNGKITDETKAYAKELVENATILAEKVAPDYVSGLEPLDLANGAAGLLEEVSTGKITGEEDMYSHLDLLDFRANLEGAQQAYASLRDGLNTVDPEAVKKIDGEFEDLTKLLDEYRDADAIGGYKAWDEALQKSDSAKLQAALDPLYKDIAALAEKVANA